MQIFDDFKITGELQIVRYDENGKITLVRDEKNLVVNTGKAYIAGRMGPTATTAMGWMAIGAPSSVNAPLPTDTALSTEIARVTITPANGTSSGTTITYVGTFPAGTGTNGSITEAGIFNASSAGAMLSRTTFAAFSKASGDTVVITWTITIT